MRTAFLTSLLMICLAASPTTQPTPDVSPEVALESAKAAVVAKLEEQPDYQAAVADAKAKNEALVEARESGTAQDRLSASAAWNKARAVVEKMKTDAFKKDPDVAKASAEADAIAAAKAKDAAAKNAPPAGHDLPFKGMQPARGNDHLEIGMTIEQVKAMAKGTMQLVAEQAGGVRVYEARVGPMQKLHWLGAKDNRDYWMAHKYSITFQDGVIEAYTQIDP